MRLPGLTAQAVQPIPTTRYARAGDVSIAYQQFGSGPVDLVWVPGFISNVELKWSFPPIADHFRRLGQHFRVIVFDKRGTGMCDRTAGAPALDERMDDIRAVMGACNVERAVIHGLSEGVPLSCMFAAFDPERTEAPVLYGGYASEFRRDDYPWAKTEEEQLAELDEDARTVHTVWGTETLAKEWVELFWPSAMGVSEIIRFMTALVKTGSTPGACSALGKKNLKIDIRHVLPSIRVPTLVMHKTGDRACKLEEGRYVAEKIPSATFVEFVDDDHVPFSGDQAAYFDTLLRFVERVRNSPEDNLEPDVVLATIACVHSPRLERNALMKLAEGALERYRARAVNRDDAGELFFKFDGPARAIRFASALTQADGALAAAIGVGTHTGDVTIRGDNAAGKPVEIARSLARSAKPGEILSTGLVRDLTGSGVAFTRQKIDAQAGVDGVWAVFRVIAEPHSSR